MCKEAWLCAVKEKIKWKEPPLLCRAGLFILEGKHWAGCVVSVLGKVGRFAVELLGVGCQLRKSLKTCFS